MMDYHHITNLSTPPQTQPTSPSLTTSSKKSLSILSSPYQTSDKSFSSSSSSGQMSMGRGPSPNSSYLPIAPMPKHTTANISSMSPSSSATSPTPSSTSSTPSYMPSPSMMTNHILDQQPIPPPVSVGQTILKSEEIIKNSTTKFPTSYHLHSGHLVSNQRSLSPSPPPLPIHPFSDKISPQLRQHSSISPPIQNQKLLPTTIETLNDHRASNNTISSYNNNNNGKYFQSEKESFLKNPNQQQQQQHKLYQHHSGNDEENDEEVSHFLPSKSLSSTPSSSNPMVMSPIQVYPITSSRISSPPPPTSSSGILSPYGWNNEPLSPLPHSWSHKGSQLPDHPTAPPEKKKRGRPPIPRVPECFLCHRGQTPEWRRGPNGENLCNACGLQEYKKKKSLNQNNQNGNDLNNNNNNNNNNRHNSTLNISNNSSGMDEKKRMSAAAATTPPQSYQQSQQINSSLSPTIATPHTLPIIQTTKNRPNDNFPESGNNRTQILHQKTTTSSGSSYHFSSSNFHNIIDDDDDDLFDHQPQPPTRNETKRSSDTHKMGIKFLI